MINPRYSSLVAVLAIALPLHAAKPTSTPAESAKASAVVIPPLPAPTPAPAVTATPAAAPVAIAAPATPSLTPIEDAIAAIQKVSAERLAQANAGETVPNRFDWSSAEAELDQIKTAALGNNVNDAKNTLRNLTRRIKSEELKKLLDNLNVAIDAQKNVELENRRQKAAQKLNDVALAALKAENAAAIDPLLEKLTTIEEELSSNYDNRLQRVRNQLSQLQSFLRQWQELLDNVNSGDTQQARQSLANFRNNGYSGNGVPRAELRERLKVLRAKLGTTASPDQLVANLSIDNLAETQQQLLESNNDYGYNNEVNDRNNVAGQIEGFLAANEALKGGNIDEALVTIRARSMNYYGSNRSSVNYATFNRLRNAWIIRALPVATGLKDLEAAKADESASAYIQRLLLAADKAENWDRALSLAHVLQLVDTTAVMGLPGAGIRANPELSIVNYQRGQLLEKAGQNDAAIDAYVEALKQGGLPKLQEKLVAHLRELPAKTK